MLKDQLRNEITNKLKSLSDEQRMTIEKDLSNKLTGSSLWEEANVIGITLSHELEWDTYQIIEKAWDQGKSVVVPKCVHKTKQMNFYKIESYEQVKEGYVGILEPIPEKAELWEKDKIKMLVVPGRVFDKDGYRIGVGGGYYDRFLEDFDNPTVSILWKEQIVENLPIESFDLPVKHLIVSTL